MRRQVLSAWGEGPLREETWPSQGPCSREEPSALDSPWKGPRAEQEEARLAPPARAWTLGRSAGPPAPVPLSGRECR